MRHLPHTRFLCLIIYQYLNNSTIQCAASDYSTNWQDVESAPLRLGVTVSYVLVFFQFFYLLGGVGQACNGDGEVAFLGVDVIDLHKHQLGDVLEYQVYRACRH